MSILFQSVGAFASQNAIFIEQDRDIGYAVDTFMLHQVRYLLITDENIELMGVLSVMDVITDLYKEGNISFLNKKVKEIMSTEIYTVDADDNVRDAILMMENMGLSGLPVVTDGNISGFFTTKDVVGKELTGMWEQVPDTNIALDDNNIGRLISEKDMITDDYTIWQIADRFLQANRRQLVVTNGQSGQFMGLITPSTILTALIPSFERKFQGDILQDTPLSNFDLRFNTFTSNSSSILLIRSEMSMHALEALPIVRDQKVVKIISEKDLVGYASININQSK